jgi:hypothetical protein
MSFQNFEFDNIIINTKNKNDETQVEPILELYRAKLYLVILKSFINDSIFYLGTKIFTVKKSVFRTLSNILSCWMFSLYINYDFSDDYFFPNNCENTNILENTLNDLIKYDLTIKEPKEKIKKILDNLKLIYKNQLGLLNEYKKSYIFQNTKNYYTINKTEIKLKKKDSFESSETHNSDSMLNQQLFYKFNIQINFPIKDKKIINILNNIILPFNTYQKLLNKYKGPEKDFDKYIWSILFRYQLLGSNNHQLAVLPQIMNQLKKDYDLNFECFASSINCTFNNYCSLYYDLEKYFGSYGSFFNITPIKGTFGFNPPYQKDLIEIGITRLFNYLEDPLKKLTFIITIPIWDNQGREEMKKLYNNELIQQNIDYGDFEIINKIRTCPYLKVIHMIPKEKFTYIDHNFELLKNKTIQNTYVIILSNQDISGDKIKQYNYLEPINSSNTNIEV